ncbi:hypothetical protein G6F62_010899 [Rhizopus arrhizus]|nr:hypothetical protein G6F66_012242 [Rhizopus arrhizus]KAG1321294.1 hypothetical protein G6F62_010899 [Rhizopus arrhizus]KAG1377563.1 hypothetical protein G6F61_006619 [Rhizopus arrhizus]
MVNDPTTDRLIRWSKEGNSFLVENHEEFAKLVLPRFYKHNTFASFVRQLNMYDFHKMPHIRQDVNPSEIWEFSNPHFQQNRSDLLVLVTRKRNRDRDETDGEKVNLGTLLKEITSIKKHQNNITADLSNLRRDNELIWKETLAAREKHQRHEQVISKILQFLTIVFSNDHSADAIHSSQTRDYEQNYKISTDTISDKCNKTSHSTCSPICSIAMPLTFNNEQHTKSVLAISQDIDELEHNVESLAAQLGINSSHLPDHLVDFTPQAIDPDYTPLIQSASKSDKAQLYRLSDTTHDFDLAHQPTAWYLEDMLRKQQLHLKDMALNNPSFSLTSARVDHPLAINHSPIYDSNQGQASMVLPRDHNHHHPSRENDYENDSTVVTIGSTSKHTFQNITHSFNQQPIFKYQSNPMHLNRSQLSFNNYEQNTEKEDELSTAY